MNLFVYGELCRATVLRGLLERLPDAEPAVLEGYSRRPDPDTGLFRIVPADGARVAGLLLRDLDSAEFARVEAFESDGYEQARVLVNAPVTAESSTVAQVFVATAVRGETDVAQ